MSDHTIVSTGAIVTKSFEGHVIIGEVLAKVPKKNISWQHSRN